VLELRKFRSRMRPWIAMVAAYALALQVLLSGIAGAHAMAAGSLSGELFVICHGSGDGPADNQNVPDTPRPAAPCLLCTLTKAPCALLPVDHGIVTSMSWWARTSLRAARAALSNLIPPPAATNAVRRHAPPFSADPFDRNLLAGCA
jgi:hypothetical protein